jgi:outer membrane protein TolC
MTGSIDARRGIAAACICVIIVAGLCLLTQAVAAQEQPAAGVVASPQPAGISTLAPHFVPLAGSKADAPRPVQLPISTAWNAALETEKLPTAGPRRISLDEAQQQAVAANNPLLRLAALSVEAAKQHRLGVQSDFFPKISSTFANLHFNKFLGQVFEVHRPNGTATFAVPLFNKDETMVAPTAMQPLTPLFKLHQVLKIARADERIARAKGGMPAAELASNVEESYFGLLIAQRRMKVATANANKVENKWRLASATAVLAGLAEHETEWVEANKALVLASSKVKEATVALNALLGWPLQTELELAIPAAFCENVSAEETVGQAMQNNPEVIEAEQTVVKARAASKLSKLDYVPDVAVVGGYAYQSIMPALPNDFSYVGLMGNYTLFDFGKREHAVKERNAQVAMAETGLMLTKAKVAASVTKAYFELDRSRQLSKFAQRMNSASDVIDARYEPEEAEAASARIEAEMLQADLDHRLAFSRLQQLIGSR